MPEETLFVHALRESRTDVSDYLDALATLRSSVLAGDDQASDEVDFGGFWARIENEIDQVDREKVHENEAVVAEVDADRDLFSASDHQMLLQRYVDNEVSAEERGLVDGWIQENDPGVVGVLDAYSELNLAANAAIEFVQEGVDLERILDGVDARIDDQVDAAGGNVVSLDNARRRRFQWGSQGALLAAGICLTLFAGLIFQQLFPKEVIIKEKTVVIVDSVEYAPGASVMVNSPIQAAGFAEGAEGEEPTVIWLLDTEDDGSTVEEGQEDAPEGDVGEKAEEEAEQEQPI
jgi:hypothetical protein